MQATVNTRLHPGRQLLLISMPTSRLGPIIHRPTITIPLYWTKKESRCVRYCVIPCRKYFRSHTGDVRSVLYMDSVICTILRQATLYRNTLMPTGTSLVQRNCYGLKDVGTARLCSVGFPLFTRMNII